MAKKGAPIKELIDAYKLSRFLDSPKDYGKPVWTADGRSSDDRLPSASQLLAGKIPDHIGSKLARLT